MHQSFLGWREKWGAGRQSQATILQQKLITATLKVKWAGYDLIRHNYPALNGCDSSYIFSRICFYCMVKWRNGQEREHCFKRVWTVAFYVKIGSTSRELGKVGHNQ